MDLQDEFIAALYAKVPRRIDLENRIADILDIEKDAAYRRLSGKVNFSIREMGILADQFRISLDRLMHAGSEHLWIPFTLESPVREKSIDAICDIIDIYLARLKIITKDPTESGNVYCSLPMEFYMHSPLLTKFMFFKWGHYFVATDEFNEFSSWELPARLTNLKEKIVDSCVFYKSFYIWDSSLIWSLALEVKNFYKMHIITADEKDAIRQELRILMRNFEKFLNGTIPPFDMPPFPEIDFYVSSINMGFTSSYYSSTKMFTSSFHTNFSFAAIEDCYESFKRMKDWIDSLRNISTLLSKSGRIERRLFFETQDKIINQILGEND